MRLDCYVLLGIYVPSDSGYLGYKQVDLYSMANMKPPVDGFDAMFIVIPADS